MLWALLLADEMQLRKSISVRLPRSHNSHAFSYANTHSQVVGPNKGSGLGIASKHLKYQGILYMSKYLKQQGFLNLFSKIKETGPDGKKEAMRKAEASGTKNCLVKVKLVAPPCYVLNTQTLKKSSTITTIGMVLWLPYTTITELYSRAASRLHRAHVGCTKGPRRGPRGAATGLSCPSQGHQAEPCVEPQAVPSRAKISFGPVR
ncbi:hypothetical protein E3N88_39789 [Mikania micrantha]|uniref:Uncharacterized protein n=1 Tax=Mikania micrantha TaxID=192012 RepID=A0A5N6LKS6_9ASTR|nr:hypothetical protein E3N88_39789 [Mikania micrantha]